MSFQNRHGIRGRRDLRASQRTNNYNAIIAELKQVQQKKNIIPHKLSSNHQQPKPADTRLRVSYLKSRASAIESDILLQLKTLQQVHQQEIEIFKERLKDKSIAYHKELRSYLFEHQKYIEQVVQQYIETVLCLDRSALKDVEHMLDKLLQKLGKEAEEAIWGKNSKWSKIKSGVKRFFRLDNKRHFYCCHT